MAPAAQRASLMSRIAELELDTCLVETTGQIATVTIRAPKTLPGGTAGHHWKLGEIFSRLRGDTAVRVVVITGEADEFYVPMRASFYGTQAARGYLVDAAGSWRTAVGIVRLHQEVSEIEKPVIAKVNGNAIGFGSTIAFACDLIVASEDAVDGLTERLLARSAYALAWTKRTANRLIADELNRSLDAGLAYELITQMHRGQLANPLRLF